MTGQAVDTSELDRWTEVLVQAPARVQSGAKGVVSKGSLNIKNRARDLAPSGPHTPHYAASISYDVTEANGETVGEIGPVEGRKQRGLGNLLEYGSQHNNPHPHHEPALDEEEPRFYAAAEALAAEPLE